MYVYIYKITSPNNKIYIGQVIEKKGIKTRLREHIRQAKRNVNKGSRILNQAIIKYGEEKFTIEKVCKIHHKLKDITEQFCIAYFNSLVPNGYNLQSGGTFTTHSEETKKKRSDSLRTLLTDPDKRKIWSDAKKGKDQGIKNNRKYEEDKLLPKYIRKIRGKYEGYSVDSHPLCKCKKFTSNKYTMEQKLNMAIDFLKSLNDKTAVQRLDGSGSLPKVKA